VSLEDGRGEDAGLLVCAMRRLAQLVEGLLRGDVAYPHEQADRVGDDRACIEGDPETLDLPAKRLDIHGLGIGGHS
jgi:hypothetical protein